MKNSSFDIQVDGIGLVADDLLPQKGLRIVFEADTDVKNRSLGISLVSMYTDKDLCAVNGYIHIDEKHRNRILADIKSDVESYLCAVAKAMERPIKMEV